MGFWTLDLIAVSAVALGLALLAASVPDRRPEYRPLLSIISLILSVGGGAWGILTGQAAAGIDVARYEIQYDQAAFIGVSQHIEASDKDIAFSTIVALFAHFGFSFLVFWAILYVAVCLLLISAIKRVSPAHVVAILMALAPLYFPFFSATHNVLRQGLAAAVLVHAISGWNAGWSWRRWLAAGTLAILIHWSAAVPFVALTAGKSLRLGRKGAWTLWAMSVVGLAVGVNARVLGPLLAGSDLSSTYLKQGVYDLAGGRALRWDFVAFTLALLVVAALIDHRRRSQSPVVTDLILVAGTYNALAFIAFSDRVAVYTWLMWPLACVGGIVDDQPQGTRRHRPLTAGNSADTGGAGD